MSFLIVEETGDCRSTLFGYYPAGYAN